MTDTAKLSAEAKTALINTGTSRQGATIPTTTPAYVVKELREAGVIGLNLGLTRKGSIARNRAVDAAMDLI